MSNFFSQLNWGKWFYGLFGGIIGGAATAGGSWVGITLAKAAGANVATLNFNDLKVIMISGGLVAMLSFLKQSPLPPPESK